MSGHEDEQARAVERHLKTLIRGLTRDNTAEIYEGYKALYRIGAPAVPAVRDLLVARDWSKVRLPGEVRYVCGLLNLVHGIDEAEARRLFGRLKRAGCDPGVARLLDAVCRFTLDDYEQYTARGVKIYRHKKLDTRQNVRARLEGWLANVPAEDLREIERIYVVPREELASLGSYRPILYWINLAWDNPSPRWSPMSWLNNFGMESTLYHEIGHHVHRHGFGQEAGQEKEADDYADRLMTNSNRLIFRACRLLASLLGLRFGPPPPGPPPRRRTPGQT